MSPRQLTDEEIEALSDRHVQLRRRLAEALAETAVAYIRIAPDGRELSSDERAQLRARLRAGASCLRELAAERTLIDTIANTEAAKQTAGIDLRRPIEALRRCDRSMILATSERGDRRAELAPVADHVTLINTALAEPGAKPGST